MKIKITEQQHKMLMEQAQPITLEGIDNVIDFFVEKWPALNTDEYKKFLSDTIRKSNVSNIHIEPFQYGIFGFTTPDKIILNSTIMNYIPLESLLFLIFHELGHGFQFKKYGAEKMYELYLGEITAEEAAEKMVEYEKVADRFALSKINELRNMGLKIPTPSYLKSLTGNYDVKINDYVNFIKKMQSSLKDKNITNPVQAATFLYNYVKNSDNIFGK